MAKRRKKRTHIRPEEAASSINPNAPKIPKCFVFKAGKVCRPVGTLVKDMRKVMEPNTAIRLKERKNNKIKDFVNVSGHLGVTQFLIFTQTENGTNFRLARVPRGPTLCFKVHKYSLIKDVFSSQINPKAYGLEYNSSPLLVLNNFNEENRHMKLMITMLQNMFPSININKIQLSDARRVVLFSYNSETKNIDFRHYLIGLKPVGISKGIRKVMTTSNLPDLHKYNDISDFILKNDGRISESEKEESGVEESSVTLAQDYIGRNNKKADRRAIKLTEIGPRMELQLIKIQNGLCDGEVLFHEFSTRRKEQEKNVERNKLEKEAHRLATSGSTAKGKQKEISKDKNNYEVVPKEYSGNYQDGDITEIIKGNVKNFVS
nr:344_t:CDS:2 [Entrophospora candida]